MPSRKRGREQGRRGADEAAWALKLGDTERAISLCESALADDARNLAILEVYAKALWRAGQCGALVNVLDRLIVLNPYEPGYRALKGSALQTLGRYGDAFECFLQCRETPGAAEALEELAEWQSGLVSEMLASDKSFAAAFARDPEQACRERGFRLAERTKDSQWSRAAVSAEWSYTRPS